jgi:hypothetical protein
VTEIGGRDIEEEKADIRSGGGLMLPTVQPPPLPTDTAYKAALFIETYTGRQFRPLFPEASAISVIDIAHALSMQCRYSGHTKFHYSVGQHSCLLASYAEQVLKKSPIECLQILMHDAPEAYLVDMPRPVKQYMPEFRTWDHRINDCVREWYGVSHLPIPAFQDELDSRIIADERAQLMSDSGNDWGRDSENPLDIIITPWTPEHTEKQFLTRYAAYSVQAFGEYRYLRETWGIKHKINFHGYSDIGGHDLIEVDFLGGVGKVKLRTDEGMLVRDKEAGTFPRPAWKWVHGTFTLQGAEDGAREN